MHGADAKLCQVQANIERLLNQDKVDGQLKLLLQDTLNKVTKAPTVFGSVTCLEEFVEFSIVSKPVETIG